MALTSRRLHREEEAESVFVSMTDIMISILFIVMIVMAFFAKSAREDIPHINELERQVAMLRAENESLRAQIIRLKRAVNLNADLMERIEALRRDNRRLREELARLEVRIEALHAENERIGDENGRLRNEIESLRHIIASLEIRVTSLEREIERLRRLLEADPLETALKGISQDRNILLNRIEEKLIAAGIKVIVDEVSGVVRFGEDAVWFASGESNAEGRSRENMRTIARILTDEMRCFTLGAASRISDDCNPNASIIEAVQIEGHTDSDGTQLSNLDLSTRRATFTYREMVDHRPDIEGYLNANYLLDGVTVAGVPGQQVLSVSGYGETRPVAHQDTSAAKRSNRRIDIRFIMTTPENVEEVERLKEAVRLAVEGQGAGR